MKLDFQLVWARDAKFTVRVPPGLHPSAPGSPTPQGARYLARFAGQALLQPPASRSGGACGTLPLPPRTQPVSSQQLMH